MKLETMQTARPLHVMHALVLPLGRRETPMQRGFLRFRFRWHSGRHHARAVRGGTVNFGTGPQVGQGGVILASYTYVSGQHAHRQARMSL